MFQTAFAFVLNVVLFATAIFAYSFLAATAAATNFSVAATLPEKIQGVDIVFVLCLVTFIAFCFSTQINYVKKEVIFHDYIKFTFKIYYGVIKTFAESYDQVKIWLKICLETLKQGLFYYDHAIGISIEYQINFIGCWMGAFAYESVQACSRAIISSDQLFNLSLIGFWELLMFITFMPVELVYFLENDWNPTSSVVFTLEPQPINTVPTLLTLDEKVSMVLKKYQKFKPKVPSKLSSVIFTLDDTALTPCAHETQLALLTDSNAFENSPMTPIRKSIRSGNVKELIAKFGSPAGPRKKLNWL